MTDIEFGRADMITGAVPTFLVVLMLLAFLGTWVGTHLFKRGFEHPFLRRTAILVRILIGSAAVWAMFQVAGRSLLLTTSWSLWFSALLCATAVEVSAWLYGLDRDSVSPGIGRVLLALRIAMIVLVVIILVQPVLSRELRKGIDRCVVVLIDDSESMHFVDRNLGVLDKLKIAALYDVEAARDRYQLGTVVNDLRDLREDLRTQQEDLAAKGDKPAAGEVKKRKKGLKESLEQARASVTQHARVVAQVALEGQSLDQAVRERMSDIHHRLKDRLRRQLDEALLRADGIDEEFSAQQYRPVREQMNRVLDELDQLLQRLPPAIAGANQAYYDSLSEDKRQAIDRGAAHTRAAIARELLLSDKLDGKSIMQRLRDKYTVKVVRFAAESEEIDAEKWIQEEGAQRLKSETPTKETGEIVAGPVPPVLPGGAAGAEEEFRQSTDLTGALEDLAEKIPPQNLAGVLLLTDGRHNGASRVEAVARTLGVQNSPVCPVVIGATDPPIDAAILKSKAPETVYLGDRMSVHVDLKLDGLRGEKVRVKLMHEDEIVDEETIDVPDKSFRTTAHFTDTPEEEGVFIYTVEVEQLEREIFHDNNTCQFDVAVSDDRTNVLLVENKPRWEYRYLRNLLYGRDKSVHLQFVLLNPSLLTDAPPLERVRASAAREFGDSEATDLPMGRSEWLKFDVIILGDIPPGALGSQALRHIEHCVENRGTLLVVISGPLHMPHAFDSSVMKRMLPIEYEQDDSPQFISPEPAYRMALTPDGRVHMITRQSSSSSENRQIWGAVPPLVWRHAIRGTKDGATVLAYAEPVAFETTPPTGAAPGGEQALPTTGTEDTTQRPSADLQALKDRIAQREERHKQNALLVIQKYGTGRVAMFNFDQTWRLRYRTGDIYHHKLWGQLLRWGTGENLRSGTDLVRVGSDKLTYGLDEPVTIIAKILDEDYEPVQESRVYARIYKDNNLLSQKRLVYRKDSNGIYETQLPPLSESGRYRIELQGRKIASILSSTDTDKVETELLVMNIRNSIELAELTADRDVPTRIAGLSDGAISTPEDASKVLDAFGAPRETFIEKNDTTLWDWWPLFCLMVGIITTEWIVRKRRGLI